MLPVQAIIYGRQGTLGVTPINLLSGADKNGIYLSADGPIQGKAERYLIVDGLILVSEDGYPLFQCDIPRKTLQPGYTYTLQDFRIHLGKSGGMMGSTEWL